MKFQTKKIITEQKGFALIATISVMALLMMVAFAMLSLSTVEVRKSKSDLALNEAKANARMALMIAIGELQKYAGPDQRVTTTASILDSNPETETIEGVAHRNWAGVWRTDGLKGENPDTPLIAPDPANDNQALIDRRQGSTYDRKDEALTWFVSGENPDPTVEGDPDKMTALYTVKSLPSGADAKDYDVYAEKVAINSSQGNALQGHYAYWASDESTKSKINIADLYPNKQPSVSDLTDGGYYKALTAQRNDLTQHFSGYDSVDPQSFEKIISNGEAALAQLGAANGHSSLRDGVRALRHDITTSSSSLIVNTTDGGLKKNLDAFLGSASGNVPGLGAMLGINDNSPMINKVSKRETIGPVFGSLRSWYKLKDATSGSLGNRRLSMTIPKAISSGTAMRDQGGIDPRRFKTQPIHPVLKEAVYYVNYAYDPKPSSRKVYELVYPRVVLWNPYNVTLETKEMYVLVDMRVLLNAKYKYKNSAGESKESSFNSYLIWGGRSLRTRAFTIPATSFKPGESLVYTVKPTGSMLKGKAVRFNDPRSDISRNILTASSDPSDLHCFYLERGALPAGTQMDTVKITHGGIFWNGANQCQSAYLFAKESSGTPTLDRLGTNAFPTLQQIHMDQYSRGNNGRWLPTYRPTNTYTLDQALGGGVSPDTLNAFGMRFRHFYESQSNRANGAALNEPWYAAPIIHSNVRAGRIHRWSRDNFFGMRYAAGAVTANYSGPAAHLYSYGPFAQCRQQSEWLDSEVAPHFKDGKYRTPVFSDASFGSSEQVYPLFDIPHKDVPLFSLASFQHVQLTPYVWHPTYAIGNSIQPASAIDGVSGQSWDKERSEWSQKVNQLTQSKNDYIHRLSLTNGNPLVYDLSYEVNHALWDNFFLSTIPQDTSDPGWSGGKWDINTPLPNSRYRISLANSNEGNYADLTDFHKTAKGLIIDGAHNVNSTSVIAWEALLRAFNDIEQPVRSGSAGSSSGHAFSRFLLPETGASVPASIGDTGLWSGFRRLSDDEIHTLAQEIVKEVKKRGPFIGLGDFVNRRLIVDKTSAPYPEISKSGALQAAINSAGINDALQNDVTSEFTMPSKTKALSYQYGADYWGGPARHPVPQQYEAYEFKPGSASSNKTLSEAAGASGYLMQGDILQKIGSTLTPRSDTFVIRTYGDAVDANGKILARAWCEAVVQRTVTPINPDTDSADLNPVKTATNNYGRRFVFTSFRWLSPNEI